MTSFAASTVTIQPQISGLDLAQIDLDRWVTDRIRRSSRAPAGMS